MPTPATLPDVLSAGRIIARAATARGAAAATAVQSARILQTPASVYQRADDGWTLIAAAPEADDPAPPDSRAVLEAAWRAQQPMVVGSDARRWTAVPLPVRSEAPLGLLLRDNWVGNTSVSTWTMVVALAIDAVRAREARAEAERHMRHAYAQLRRLSRPAAVEMVAERIVADVRESLKAEKVSLALYHAADDVLAVEATSVSPASGILEARIQPGTWAVGHVFATGRPLFVRDVRQLGGAAAPAGRYRTTSFAAVPLLSGRQRLGVLTVTDKADRTALTRADCDRLRTYASIAAIGLAAARSHHEADRLAHAATIDSLTGLVNRSYLEARLHQEVERAKRGDNPPGILIADVDDFKMINDTHGHQTGDAVLRAVGRVLRSAVRVFDVCARYGGDEFAILMLNGDRASAAACGERIRRRVAGYHNGTDGVSELPPFTMSIGIALLEPGDTPSDLISRADRCLYQAKAEGKNRVRMHRGPTNQPSPFRIAGDEQEPM